MAQKIKDLQFPNGRRATLAYVETEVDLPGALLALEIRFPRPVLVLVGGAGGLQIKSHEQRLWQELFRGLAGMVQARDAIIVDGGTEAGIMAMIGRARTEIKGIFPLLGVAAAGTIDDLALSVDKGDDEVTGALLDSHHTHFILVPGEQWGDESAWITQTATILTAGEPSITLLINGGQISRRDVAGSLAAKRPTVAVAGTGRLADELAAASTHTPGLYSVDLRHGWRAIAQDLQVIWA